MAPTPRPADGSETFTVRELAQLTGYSKDAIYEAIAAGSCPWPVLRMGRAIRIPRVAVLASLGLDGLEG